MTEHLPERSGQGRRYHSPRRVEQAVATRRAVLDAARDLFVDKGYLATTVADVARQARVAVDTVYATVGRKPALLREVLDYVVRMRAATSAREKIQIYVAGLIKIQPRLAPVYLALRDAASTDAESAALWSEISGRRATNMRMFAADMRATGELRADLSDDEVADVVWSMNGPEYWTLLVGDRGWSPERFGAFVVDVWTRLLLAAPDAR
jgi:AcrR family transcriptional regulator